MKELNRADVESFLHWHAVAAEAKQHLDELRPTLLQSLLAGLSSPADLPFLLTVRISERMEKDYKTPLFTALKRILGSKEKAEKRLAAIEKGFEKKEVQSLVVERNVEYAKEQMSA